eukprot:m.150809 g.150809  ORF g.150809 m.150809 type:complete len:222 (-) comp15030_c0_seq9:1528-2193(-)
MFLITMLAIVSRIKDLNDGRCVFCTKTASYDISSIPTGTVHILHSGIKGAPMNSSNVYRTYYVTSPCGSNANTTGCVAGPTASPVAYRPATAPVCQSVGSLKDSGPAATTVSENGNGITITMVSLSSPQGRTYVEYKFVCNASASPSNPPHSHIDSFIGQNNHTYVITWQHPSVCGGGKSPGGCAPPPAPPPAICVFTNMETDLEYVTLHTTVQLQCIWYA